MSKITAFLQPQGGEPDWSAGEKAIQAVDASMFDRMESNTWGSFNDLTAEGIGGQGEYLIPDSVQEVLRDDLQKVRDAIDTPPEPLLALSFEDKTYVHYLEGEGDDDGLGDALDRLHDFGVVQATRLVVGGW